MNRKFLSYSAAGGEGPEQTTGGAGNKINRHLEKARELLEVGITQTSGDKKKILKDRAIALAREDESGERAEQYIETVEFLLAHEKYAIETVYISEIFPLKELTPLPCTPSFVLGIINVRGKILSVIDLKNFFDLPAKGITDLDRVIVVHTDGMELGILADVIIGVRFIPLNEIQPPLPTLTGIRAEYLKGVTSERLVVLDTQNILSDKSIIVCEEVD